MGNRGRERDLDREIRYWELIAKGVGTVAARGQVDVSVEAGEGTSDRRAASASGR